MGDKTERFLLGLAGGGLQGFSQMFAHSMEARRRAEYQAQEDAYQRQRQEAADARAETRFRWAQDDRRRELREGRLEQEREARMDPLHRVAEEYDLSPDPIPYLRGLKDPEGADYISTRQWSPLSQRLSAEHATTEAELSRLIGPENAALLGSGSETDEIDFADLESLLLGGKKTGMEGRQAIMLSRKLREINKAKVYADYLEHSGLVDGANTTPGQVAASQQVARAGGSQTPEMSAFTMAQLSREAEIARMMGLNLDLGPGADETDTLLAGRAIADAHIANSPNAPIEMQMAAWRRLKNIGMIDYEPAASKVFFDALGMDAEAPRARLLRMFAGETPPRSMPEIAESLYEGAVPPGVGPGPAVDAQASQGAQAPQGFGLDLEALLGGVDKSVFAQAPQGLGQDPNEAMSDPLGPAPSDEAELRGLAEQDAFGSQSWAYNPAYREQVIQQRIAEDAAAVTGQGGPTMRSDLPAGAPGHERAMAEIGQRLGVAGVQPIQGGQVAPPAFGTPGWWEQLQAEGGGTGALTEQQRQLIMQALGIGR